MALSFSSMVATSRAMRTTLAWSVPSALHSVLAVKERGGYGGMAKTYPIGA
jgi:hypothetical protein